MKQRFSLHEIVERESPGFDPVDYSRFKHGDGKVAEKWGEELACAFYEKVFRFLPDNRPTVALSSPFCHIPTASFFMYRQFLARINRLLAADGRPVVSESKIFRTVTYRDDYGSLNASERLRLIGNDLFQLDRHFLAGKRLLLLDDIRITGSHETVIERALEAHDLLDCQRSYLFFAELANHAIHPNIENHLNNYAMKSLDDLHEIIQEGHFRLNTRVVKWVLAHEPIAFQSFFKKQGDAFWQPFFDAAIGNSYHEIGEYQKNLNFLARKLHESVAVTGAFLEA